jgi:hypothetical protein
MGTQLIIEPAKSDNQYAQFRTKVGAKSYRWKKKSIDSSYEAKESARTEGKEDDPLPPSKVTWRPFKRARADEKEMAQWVIDDWDPDYYDDSDIEKVRFSRQYLDKQRKVLGYFMYFPEKHKDYPQLAICPEMYESGGSFYLDGEVFVYSDAFSDVAPNFAELEIERDGKRIRLSWVGAYEGGYVEVAS